MHALNSPHHTTNTLWPHFHTLANRDNDSLSSTDGVLQVGSFPLDAIPLALRDCCLLPWERHLAKTGLLPLGLLTHQWTSRNNPWCGVLDLQGGLTLGASCRGVCY